MDVPNGSKVINVDAEGDTDMDIGGQEKLGKRKVRLLSRTFEFLSDIITNLCSSL
jgi:hypothetical protein